MTTLIRTTDLIVIEGLKAEAFLTAELPADRRAGYETELLARIGCTAPGWYLTRQWPGTVTAGPFATLAECYAAAGVEYPGQTSLRTASGAIAGDLEAVVQA